jgi:endonuclease YncB( thermonuclease family)
LEVGLAHLLLSIALLAGSFGAAAPSLESLKNKPFSFQTPGAAPPRTLGLESFHAEVVFVPDGDTVTAKRDGKSFRIRLYGVDAPESSQPFGRASGKFLWRLIGRKTVRVRVVSEDQYGRVLATLYNDDGTNVNAAMVGAGMAWWYRYFSDDAELERLEREAREARRGLWSQDDPEPPWDYRRRTRGPGSFETGDPLEAPLPEFTPDP